MLGWAPYYSTLLILLLALALSPDGKVVCVVTNSTTPLHCQDSASPYSLPNIPMNLEFPVEMEMSFENNRYSMCITQLVSQSLTCRCVYFQISGTVVTGLTKTWNDVVSYDTSVVGGYLAIVVSTANSRTTVASYPVDATMDIAQSSQVLTKHAAVTGSIKYGIVRSS